MSAPRTYRLTTTANGHYQSTIAQTRATWGTRQAQAYRGLLVAGFKAIAEGRVPAPLHRKELAKGTHFSVRLVEHHYIAYIRHKNGNAVIAGLFHEKMDIPARLRELQIIDGVEIAALLRAIGRGP